MSPKHINFKIKWYVVVPVVLLSLFIFAMSVTRASWINLSDDNNFDRFRINPIEFEIEKGPGDWEKVKYYLPQVNQIPGQLFYPIKRIRDNLWLKMSIKSNRDAKLYLLLADKKIAEVLVFSQKSSVSEKYMFESGKEAVSYLEIAKDISMMMENKIEANKIRARINVAKYFYSQILQQVGEVSGRMDEFGELSDKVLSIETKK